MKRLIIDTNKWSEGFAHNMGRAITLKTGGNSELTPSWGNNGYGHCAPLTDEGYQSGKDHHLNYIINKDLNDVNKTLDFYKNTRMDVSYYLNQKENIEEEIERLKARDKSTFLPYPVKLSVSVGLPILDDSELNPIIEQYTERAHQFALENNITITDIRVVTAVTDALNSNELTTISHSDRTDIKVNVTAYKGYLFLETLNKEDKDDYDFKGAGGGVIGCTLNNTKRLGISPEAMKIIKCVKNGRDAIGDLCGGRSNFSWIGGWDMILGPTIVGSRDFKMTDEYQTIDNIVPDEVIKIIDKKEDGQVIDYNDIKFDLWIEMNKYEDSYKVNLCMHDAHFYDEKITIVNVPDEVEVELKDNKNIRVTKENYLKVADILYHNILGEKLFIPRPPKPDSEKSKLELEIDEMYLKLNLFRDGDLRHSYKGYINEKDIWDYVNSFFDLGFFNNIMNPREDYFRLSFKGTISEIIEKLSKFQLVTSEKEV